MVSLRTPYSGVPINVPDDLVERYKAAGYVPTEEPKKSTARTKRAPSKPAAESADEE